MDNRRPKISVASVGLDQSAASVVAGKTVKLTATVKPDNATNKAIVWTSSDETKATVADGTVTGKAAGTATITATSADNSEASATCKVTVTAASS